jgi:hypothetical protein
VRVRHGRVIIADAPPSGVTAKIEQRLYSMLTTFIRTVTDRLRAREPEDVRRIAALARRVH